jgi:hypothetical protein
MNYGDGGFGDHLSQRAHSFGILPNSAAGWFRRPLLFPRLTPLGGGNRRRRWGRGSALSPELDHLGPGRQKLPHLSMSRRRFANRSPRLYAAATLVPGEMGRRYRDPPPRASERLGFRRMAEPQHRHSLDFAGLLGSPRRNTIRHSDRNGTRSSVAPRTATE